MKRPAADGFLENSLSGVPKVQVGRRISQAKGQKDGRKTDQMDICLKRRKRRKAAFVFCIKEFLRQGDGSFVTPMYSIFPDLQKAAEEEE